MIYALALVIAAFYSWAVATTEPFTVTADVLVSVGFVLMGVPLAGRLRRRREGPKTARPDKYRTGKLTPWVVTIGVLAVVQLSVYFAGWSAGRHDYPTLSSLYDEATSRSETAKAVLVFLWMSLGWGLFRPRPAPPEPS
ncbi:MAG TPA: hypothetical protein VNF71_03455 [Acidimicrobiales bacterium]|nr:hypothetical protein [Acidimicrobiales bacterium]